MCTGEAALLADGADVEPGKTWTASSEEANRNGQDRQHVHAGKAVLLAQGRGDV
jgi:hypothetical protein